MFSTGDYVVYGDSDVCRIIDIGVPELKFHQSTGKLCYFLKPLFYEGMIYAPTDTQITLRPVISRSEALSLIFSLPEISSFPCASGDKKKMIDHYDQLMKDHTCPALAQTAKSIYEKYHASAARTKLPNSTEAVYYKKASDLLLQELSVALGESVAEIQRRIEKIVSPDEPMKWSL